MRKTILSAAAAVAVTMLSAGFAAAQTAAKAPADPAKVRAEVDKAIEVLRKDARAGKSDILGKTMALDSAQAAAFWPLYKQYEAEVQTLGNERLAIIQDLADHFDSIVTATAAAAHRIVFFIVLSLLDNASGRRRAGKSRPPRGAVYST